MLGCLPPVMPQQTSEALITHARAVPRNSALVLWKEQQVALALMVPLLVIVFDELAQCGPETGLTEEDTRPVAVKTSAVKKSQAEMTLLCLVMKSDQVRLDLRPPAGGMP